MSERSPRLPALDALRALAIAWVVIRHLLSAGLLPWKLTLATLLWVGNAGVDLFFVLSGFLIGRIVYRELESTGSLNVTQFWRRRWLRTLPAYFASLAFIRLSDLVLDDTFEWDRLWTYLVFLQTYASRLTRFNWSWSLCVEEHFYLLLPLLVLALSRGVKRFSAATTLRCLAAAAVLFSVCYRLSLYLGAPHSAEAWAESYLTTHCRLDGLGIGLALATVPPFRAGRRLTVGLTAVALG